VQHQTGYYIEKDYRDFTPVEKQVQLAEFVSKDLVSQRIPFEFSALAWPYDSGLVLVTVVMEIEGGPRMAAWDQRREDHIRLEVYGYLLDEMNRPLDHFESSLDFATDEAKENLQSGGIKYYGCFLARPGRYKVKCIVRDSELGNISSDVRVITAPDFTEGGLHMVGPMFVERAGGNWINVIRDAGEKTQGMHRGSLVEYPYSMGENTFIPSLSPEIAGAQVEYAFVRLLGLCFDPDSPAPQIDIRVEITEDDGRSRILPRVVMADQHLNRNAGTLDLLLQIDFSEIDPTPGHHTLRLTLTDRADGASATGEADFTIPRIP